MLSILLLATSLCIHTPKSDVFFQAQEAKTTAQKEKGLQGVNHLNLDEGMLFIYEHEGYETFWMKNMSIPLALLFINAKHRIIDIQYGAPYSTKLIQGKAPYQYVLEISPRAIIMHHIQVGQKISFEASTSLLNTHKKMKKSLDE